MPVIELLKSTTIRGVGNEQVLLNLDNGQYFSLDEVGARILDLLQQLDNLETVIQELSKEYDVSKEELVKDIDEIVGQLVDSKLVKFSDR